MHPAVGTILPDVGHDRLGVERAPLFGRISLTGCPPWCGRSPRCNCRARTPTRMTLLTNMSTPSPTDLDPFRHLIVRVGSAVIAVARWLLFGVLIFYYLIILSRVLPPASLQLWLVIAVMSGFGFAMALAAKSPPKCRTARAGLASTPASSRSPLRPVFGHRRKPALSPWPPRSWH
jgi:hypothetical protein